MTSVSVRALFKKLLRGRLIAVLVLGLLTIASGTSLGTSLANACGAATVRGFDRQYLQDAGARATTLFLVISGIKATLAVVEGSSVSLSVGVGGELSIGDVVQSLHDFVDAAWRTVLAGLVAIHALKLLLDLAEAFGPGLLTVALALFTLHLALGLVPFRLGGLKALSAAGTAFVCTAALVISAGLPLAVYSAGKLSAAYTDPLKEETLAALKQFRERSLPPVVPGAREMGLGERLEALLAYLQTLGQSLTQLTRDLSAACIKLMAAYLFDCLIFPGGILALLYLLVRSVVRQALRYGERRSALDEMARLMQQQSAAPVAQTVH